MLAFSEREIAQSAAEWSPPAINIFLPANILWLQMKKKTKTKQPCFQILISIFASGSLFGPNEPAPATTMITLLLITVFFRLLLEKNNLYLILLYCTKMKFAIKSFSSK